MNGGRGSATDLAHRLTGSEYRVALAVGRGATNKAVARELGVSVKTIEFHLSRVYRKLDVSGRTELAGLVGAALSAERTITLLVAVRETPGEGADEPAQLDGTTTRVTAVLREEINDAGGEVVTVSDSTAVAIFALPSEAAQAAVACQARLAGERSRNGHGPPLSMGIHTGIAGAGTRADIGPLATRAERIARAARGGQVLTSAGAAALLADQEWTVLDIGLHALEGLERPERLFRVRAESLADVDLPLRGVDDVLGNLPRWRSAWVGREGPLAHLVGSLTDGALVTVTGTGGVGKTRLALAAAHRAGRRFSHGAWLVELGNVRSAHDVPAAVATALGLRPQAGARPADAVATALQDQHRLIILDNCEHVLDRAAELAEAIGHRCARTTILATSRQRLEVEGERLIELMPMDVDAAGLPSEAAQLFVVRATELLGDFDPSADELRIVEDLCRRVDGLPLAIELAAARLPGSRLDELHAALEARFRLLTRRRAARDRHGSLAAAVAWSYDLLPRDERDLFDRLSVFTGSFDPPAALAVAAVPSRPDTIEHLLARLVARSLLSTTTVHPDGHRYLQLETLRAFGAERLARRGRAVTLRRRHLEYFAAWARAANDGIRTGDELQWHAALQIEWHNLRSAFGTALELDDADAACELVQNLFWWAMSRLTLELGEWAEAALALPSAVDHPLRPTLAACASHFTYLRGDQAHAAELLTLAWAEEARLGPASEPWVPCVATFQAPRGDPLEYPLEVQRRAGDDSFWAILGNQQECAVRAFLVSRRDLSAEEVAAHLARIRHGIVLAESHVNRNGLAYSAMTLGWALRRLDPYEALALLERAIDVAAPLELEITVAQARRELAILYTDLQRPLDTLALLRPAIRRHLRAGAFTEVRVALGGTLRALIDTGHAALAARVVGSLRQQRTGTLERAMPLRDLDLVLRHRLPAGTVDQLLLDGADLTTTAAATEVLAVIDGQLDGSEAEGELT